MIQTSALQTEYIIYTYDRFSRGQNWKKHMTTSCEATAMAQSKALYETRSYKKIELKRKYLDPHTNQWGIHTVKSWGEGGAKAKSLCLYVFQRGLRILGGFTSGFFQAQQKP